MQKVKINPRYFTILGILLHLLIGWLAYSDFYSWLLIDQTFFHLTLFAAVVVLIWGRLNFLVLSLLLVLSYFVADYRLIDEALHEYFIKWQIFPHLWSHHGFVNPQYTKLLLYALVTSLLLIKICFKRFRTNDSFFVFLSCVASLTVTFVIHFPVIRQGLEVHLKAAQSDLSRFLDVVHSPSAAKDLGKHLQSLCESRDYECLLTPKIEEVNEALDEAMNGQHQFRISESSFHTSQPKILRSSGYFEDHEWKRFLMGVSYSPTTSDYLLVIGEERVNALQKQYEEIFSVVAACAHFVWGWLLIVLGFFHKEKWKKRLLAKQRQPN